MLVMTPDFESVHTQMCGIGGSFQLIDFTPKLVEPAQG
jgi:hypothetical protein